jgi:hypothetical protein
LGIREKDLEWWACKKKIIFKGVEVGLGCGGWASKGGGAIRFDYLG